MNILNRFLVYIVTIALCSINTATVLASEETVLYSYDALLRLTGVEYVGKGAIHYQYDKAGDVTGVTILVTDNTLVDSDQDGIDDNWELFYFGNLTTASATEDYDRDRYSDLWEYLNWRDGVLDPGGNGFDPLQDNISGGTGYNLDITNSSFWLLFLPTIIRQ